MRELLHETFRKDGYVVDEVEDGLELKDYLAACKPWGTLPCPDVVVSDVRMPGLTALDVLAQLKMNVSRIVLITAFGDPKTHIAAKLLGAAAVLDKPVDLAVLLETVRRVLRHP